MTWYDIDDILYEGTKEEIKNVLCPDCGGEVSYRYSDEPRGFEIRCVKCGYLSRATGGPEPKCVTHFGKECTIKKELV